MNVGNAKMYHNRDKILIKDTYIRPMKKETQWIYAII